MTNPITRRFALFRIASTGAAAAVAAVPVAIAAVQPKNPESAELIRLGDEMAAAAKHFTECDAARSAAKRECDRLWPQVPEEQYAPMGRGYAVERDCDDKPIDRAHNDKKFPYARDYLSADIVQAKLAELPTIGETEDDRQWRMYLEYLLPKAIAYDEARATALAATDYEATVSAWYAAEFAVTQLLRKIAGLAAITPLGVTIKAQAYQACAALGKEGRFQASIHLGPSIADDVCRILSEAAEEPSLGWTDEQAARGKS